MEDIVPIRSMFDNVNVEAMDNGGRTPLSRSAEKGDEAVTKLLLDKGANSEAKDPVFERTPLLWAVVKGHEAITKLLLGKGANLEEKDGILQLTPLAWAAEKGHEAVTKLLLDKGANFEAKDRIFERTPLSWAAGMGHEAVTKLLLDKGADFEAKDRDYQQTPLLWATEEGHEAVTKLLLDKGANFEAKDRIFEQTPLLWAAEKGHEAVTKLLLDKGANSEAKDRNFRRTPLSWAAEKGHEAVTKLLLDQGANFEATDRKFRRTPLSWAAEMGHEAVTKLLLDKGANFEAKDPDFKQTPLLWATKKGHEAVTKLLLDKGADFEAKDRVFERTPLLWAAEEGHEAVVKLLLDRGADVSAKDMLGFMPLSWAAGKGHEAIVKLLLDGGADVQAKGLEGRPLSWAYPISTVQHIEKLNYRQPGESNESGDLETSLRWRLKIDEENNKHRAKLLSSHNRGNTEVSRQDSTIDLETARGLFVGWNLYLVTDLHFQKSLSAPSGRFILERANRWMEMELQWPVTITSAIWSTSIVCFDLDLKDFFYCLSSGPLESLLTLTIDSPSNANAIAVTMREYVTKHWGKAGWDIVSWLGSHSADAAPAALHLPVLTSPLHDAPGGRICVELRGRDSNSAAGQQDSQFACEARWIGGTKTEFDHIIVDLTRQLAWIVATFKASPDIALLFLKTSHEMRPSFTKVKFEQKLEHLSTRNSLWTSSIVSGGFWRCFRITQEDISDAFSNNSKGTCWHSLFSSMNAAVGFPISSRPEVFSGVELPLTLMASLASVGYSVRYKGGFVLKGYHNALIPVPAGSESGLSVEAPALQWHLYSTGTERLYMSKVKEEEPELEPLATNSNEDQFTETIQDVPRHFLGLYSRATVRIGTNLSRMDEINTIPADNFKPIHSRRLLEWTRAITASAGGGGLGLSSAISTGFRLRSPKEREMRFSVSTTDNNIIQDTLTKPAILYDTQTQVAWMLPQIRVILYLIQAWARVQHRTECESVNYPTFNEHSISAGDLRQILDSAWSQKPHIRFEEQFMWYCKVLDALQVDEDLKPAKGFSEKLAGVDFARLAVSSRHYSILRAPINPRISGHWLKMLKSNWKNSPPYRVLTLFCDVLHPAPIKPDTWMCSTWYRPPRNQNYLVATLGCLRTLAYRHQIDPVQFSKDHECRRGPSNLLQDCIPGICNPLQKIEEAKGVRYLEMTGLLTLTPTANNGTRDVLIFGNALPNPFPRDCCTPQPPPQQQSESITPQFQHNIAYEIPAEQQNGVLHQS
ncbi:hypothetical protein QQS21_006650 [Conoideocrella luteorostrata]|uniref:Uncharacterized protein n=1 Tax=Conoideocrella luteorostrata TaxID=1105319 RepID=A0AAJ0FY23_9HYPO|nr:hypothetical protein QQS21_006650 [Conoideocrella luteorostrata]